MPESHCMVWLGCMPFRYILNKGKQRPRRPNEGKYITFLPSLKFRE